MVYLGCNLEHSKYFQRQHLDYPFKFNRLKINWFICIVLYLQGKKVVNYQLLLFLSLKNEVGCMIDKSLLYMTVFFLKKNLKI